MKPPPMLSIAFTFDYDEACRHRDLGYEPIECAYGQKQSVLGPLCMDHHGFESHREGVALRACRDHYGARRDDPRFVVTGTPDADAVLAIVALAGLVPEAQLTRVFYELVDRHDVDPIGLDLLTVPGGVELAWFNQRPGTHNSVDGFRRAIDGMVELLSRTLTSEERARVVAAERSRRRKALEGVSRIYELDGRTARLPTEAEIAASPVRRGEDVKPRVLVVHGTVWGFDMWYRLAPVVVSFASRLEKVTVGCPDRVTAEALFGPGGLQWVWPRLGADWGGRETIGGSPRGVKQRATDADDTARLVLEALQERLVKPS